MIDFKIESAHLHERMGMNQKQVTKVVAVSLTQVAYHIQQEVRATILRVFDKPSPFVTNPNAVKVKQAKIEGDKVIGPEISILGQKRGSISPAHALFAEVAGGKRANKASESLLSNIAPSGRPQWRPGAGAELDAFGNLRGGTIRQILSAMQANRDQGVTSNSRVRGVSGLARNGKDVDEIMKARREDEYARFKRFNDASEETRAIMRLQAKSRLSDFSRRLKNDESRYKEAKPKIKTWLFASGTGKGKPRAIIYAFDWVQKFSPKLGRMVYKKANLKPILVFTKEQSYPVKLPFADIARQVVTKDIRKIWDDTAMRLFVKWNSK